MSSIGVYQVTLLRHGRSAADDEGRFEGRYDSPLTSIGIDQATKLAGRWKADADRSYDRVIASPLRRAAETARIVGAALGVAVAQDPLWMERDSGRVAGMSREEGARAFPLPDFVGPYDRLAAGSAESVVELHARAMRAVQALLDLPAGRYLVVAHGGILNAAVSSILGLPVPVNNGGAFFRFGDTCHMDLRYERREHRWTVMELAD
jgi:2,3-bisphosphoglycerate-dependent phosphoglycerate mutase